MRNCIVAQSGGPTSVINASAVGIYEKNLETKYFNKVFFGINGIEGILKENIINTTDIDKESLAFLKNTPSSGLGSCRYKLPDFNDNDKPYENTIHILKKYNIDTFFYIGGNDSMDTVCKFSKYCAIHNHEIKFIGIPKTIDNDLLGTDNCPGFGSAGKYIATTVLETYLDASVYPNNGVFILETMGRDTGWLASTSALATINNKPVVDLIYLPECIFDADKFLLDVERIFKAKNKVYIVASEGIKDKEGKFLAESKTSVHDSFGHKQLGGVANALKNIIIDKGITSRVKTIELGTAQRCAYHLVSNVDLSQAYEVGAYGVNLASENKTGVMAVIKSNETSPYSYSLDSVDISSIANKIKYFPSEWINVSENNINSFAIDYLKPLIGSLPSYTKIYE